MHELAVTAIGRDRPGIVAGFTKVLFELGCNLADCAMTRLAGQFAMILLVQAPDELSLSELEQALAGPSSQFGLSLNVQEAVHSEASVPAHPYVISIYGGDHPGIVYRISQELASRAVNVTDLVSRVVGDNVYTMVLEVDLPDGLDAASLEEELAKTAREVGVELTLRPSEAAEL